MKSFLQNNPSKKKKKTNKNVFLQTYRSTDPEQFDPRQWRNFLRKTRQLVALRLARNTLRERRMYEYRRADVEANRELALGITYLYFPFNYGILDHRRFRRG